MPLYAGLKFSATYFFFQFKIVCFFLEVKSATAFLGLI